MTLNLADWRPALASLNELRTLGVQPTLPATVFRSVRGIRFSTVSNDPPVGGQLANAVTHDTDALNEGIWNLWWSVLTHAGSTGIYWAVQLIDPAGNRQRIGTLRSEVVGALRTYELDGLYVPEAGWKIGLQNTVSMADADVQNLYVRAWPYTS